MMDPVTIIALAANAAMFCSALVLAFNRQWLGSFLCAFLLFGYLYAIALIAGYPTNQSFPSHAIVYGLTNEHVWAAPKNDPYPPRSYIFKAPPTWHEEKSRRRGEPFEVLEVPNKQDETQERSRSDRTSEGHYVIHRHGLPPKGE